MAYAAYRPHDLHPLHLLLEAIGGLLGGRIGAKMPDIIDPPTSPNHRSIGHGVVPVVAGTAVAVRGLDRAQPKLRQRADRHAAARAQSSNRIAQLLHLLAEWACRIGAGVLAGIIAGYGSHIALDAFTPAGLPVLA
jgi:hypothetical protein